MSDLRTSEITPIGVTNYRNQNIEFGIKDNDRLRHLYVIGKTGVGKSTLLKNMAISDITRGNGLCVLDPHGDIAQALMEQIPQHRMQDIVYLDATNLNLPFGLNPLYAVHPNSHNLVASSLIAAFKKLWIDNWGPRLEYILRYSLLTLLCNTKATLLDIQPLLTNPKFRNVAIGYVDDENIISFWKDEFDKYSPSFRNEAITPILNKVGVLNASPLLRNIVCKTTSALDIKELLDSRKVLIVNLSKGKVGEDMCSLLGSLLLTTLLTTAMQRVNQTEDSRVPFYLYIDECHSFMTLSIANILSEARKYGLSLFLTNQYLAQLDERIRAGIIGNVGSLIAFNLGSEDAQMLENEFYPVFTKEDLTHLPRFHMYLKLMIDGYTSEPFSAVSLPDC